MDELIKRQDALDALCDACALARDKSECIFKNLESCMDHNAILDVPAVEERWIPCSEKPDTERNVFVARGTSESMSVCVGHYDHGLEQWYEDRNWFAKCLYDGMYWCEIPPLPEPYKGGE